MPTTLTRKKVVARKSSPVAKKIVQFVRGKLRGYPEEEQMRRAKAFCDALDGQLQPRSNTSESSRSARNREVTEQHS